MKNLIEFIEATINDGGATYNLVTRESPTDGYMVSELGYERVIKGTDDINESVSNYIREHGFTLNNPINYLGSWVDDGYLYLDISRNYDTLEVAMRHARTNEQLAIYDITNNKTIEL
jgi:hypothetical protein